MDPTFRFDLDGAEAPQIAQAPWEFAGVAEAVDVEHAKRKTTSIDHKIQEQLRGQRAVANNGMRWKPPATTEEGEEDGSEDDDEHSEEEEAEPVEERYMSAREKKKLPGKAFARDGLNGGEGKRHLMNGAVATELEDEDGEDNKGASRGRNGRRESRNGAVSVGEARTLAREEGESSGDDEDSDEDRAKERKQLPRVKVEDLAGPRGKNSAGDDRRSLTAEEYFASAEGASFTATSFAELNLSRPLTRACEALGYTKPTPIQAACVPLALTGRDICGSAVTGSGKTAAFALPVLERLLFRPRRVAATRVLVLTPTRELAVQVHSMVTKLAQFTDIRTCLVVGGLSQKAQEAALRGRPDVVVATPGRMIDHLHNTQSVGLEEVAVLVLDEADRLLEMGFTQEVQEIVRMCPRQRQTLLFSATMTAEVAELIRLSLNQPVRLSADPLTMRPVTLSEEVIKIRPQQEGEKEAILLALATRTFKSKAIIFSQTKLEAHRLKVVFGLAGLNAAELHGNLTQAMRLDALESFRTQAVDFLIATDVAARGLDIMGVETVINFDCPRDITSYVHRVGRTARAGRRGCAVTLATEKDRQLLKAMAKRAGSRLKSREVAPSVIAKWRTKIEEMEYDIATINRQEREERALRKAEMEANKAQNLVEHEAEIYSRPAKSWFQSRKERLDLAAVVKEKKLGTADGANGPAKKVVSAEDAAEQRKKEKLKLEREKKLPRKKRRRLEEKRREAEEGNDGGDDDDDDGEDGDEGEDQPPVKKHRPGTDNKGGAKQAQQRKGPQSADSKKGGGGSVVEAVYRKAKAVKAAARAREAGKIPFQKGAGDGTKKKKKDKKKVKSGAERDVGRAQEMKELFRGDKGEGGAGKGGKRGGVSGAGKKMGKRKAFKSKARYKRRK